MERLESRNGQGRHENGDRDSQMENAPSHSRRMRLILDSEEIERTERLESRGDEGKDKQLQVTRVKERENGERRQVAH